MTRNPVDVVMFTGIYGDWYTEIADPPAYLRSFMDRCVDAGIQSLVPNYMIGSVSSHPWVISHRPAGVGKTEFRGNFWLTPPEEPDALSVFVEAAHAVNLTVHPYIHIGCGGVWLPKYRSPVGERLPLGYADGFGSQHPKWWSRARDGRSWLDMNPSEPNAMYGYLSVAFAEVRQYVVSQFVHYVKNSGVDGVSLEFVTSIKDAAGSWLFGYDGPVIDAYRALLGREPEAADFDAEEWQRLRAANMTLLVRELHDAVKALKPDIDISVATEGVWHDPANAYRVMVDWPTWTNERLIDTLYPRFWLFQPPDLQSSLPAGPKQIKQGIETVIATAGGNARVYGGLICASFGGEANREEMGQLLLDGARAAMEAGAAGVGIHRVDTIVALDLWHIVRRIADGDF
jgi:hypothetical protein